MKQTSDNRNVRIIWASSSCTWSTSMCANELKGLSHRLFS